MKNPLVLILCISILFVTGCSNKKNDTKPTVNDTCQKNSISFDIQSNKDEEIQYMRRYEPEEEEKHTLHPDSKHVYDEDEVDISPSFPNGINAKMSFILKNRKASLLEGLHKVITVEIIVEKDGSISSAKIVRSIDKVHDEDALAIIKKMPIWQPAMIGNTKVRCKSKVHIPYRVK